ncbi:MAG: nucleotidyltransferase domain-containing protein [Nitrospirae bacterium]|nr:MAG: nucleotidyltransferase domain-containing protein [Nitrospirota bacterium]
MTKRETDKLRPFFESCPEIKLVYFFGSRAKQSHGKLSDYDFAIYLESRNRERMYEIKIDTIVALSRLLKSDKIDVVILNLTVNSDLKYLIVKEGRLIYEKEPFKLLVEPKIYNEYFDFHKMMAKYNLTKALA